MQRQFWPRRTAATEQVNAERIGVATLGRIGAPVVIALVLSMVACGGSAEKEESEEAEARAEAQESGGGTVPQAVLSIEGEAEDAIDTVYQANWDKVRADAEAISTNWGELIASPASEGVTDSQRASMDEAIADLRNAVDAKDELLARQAANDVSKVVVDVFDLFEFNIPSDIGRLDWMERQVIIDADRHDWPAVLTDLSQIRETFGRVRSNIVAAGGEGEVVEFDDSLNKQDRLAASEDGGIVEEANIALELVDNLERVY